MKFTNLNVSLIGIFITVLCSINIANAGLISHAAGTKAVARYCPESTNYTECWNRTQNSDNKILSSETNYASNDAASETSAANWINTSFGGKNFTLPEVHLFSDSANDWTNFLFSFSYQQYLWEGEDDTLTISSDFSFTKTTGTGWAELQGDSHYAAMLSISKDISDDIHGGSWKPIIDPEDIIVDASYASNDDKLILSGVKQSRSISTTFNVSKGDTFYVMSHVKASANNGGWVDSANSLYTSVTADITTDEQLALDLLSIKRPDPTAVPEPSTLGFFALGFIALIFRRLRM